jgi:hypothetical protein
LFWAHDPVRPVASPKWRLNMGWTWRPCTEHMSPLPISPSSLSVPVSMGSAWVCTHSLSSPIAALPSPPPLLLARQLELQSSPPRPSFAGGQALHQPPFTPTQALLCLTYNPAGLASLSSTRCSLFLAAGASPSLVPQAPSVSVPRPWEGEGQHVTSRHVMLDEGCAAILGLSLPGGPALDTGELLGA